MQTLGNASNRQMSWDEVAALEDLIGGDLEIQDKDLGVSRGPVCEIRVDRDYVAIQCDWRAEPVKDRGWVLRDEEPENARFVFDHKYLNAIPRDAGDGRVSFHVDYTGPCMLYPKGYQSNLSRDQVRDK